MSSSAAAAAAATALKFLTVAPTAKHSATVVLMHGLGDSGHGWLDVAQALARSHGHIKFILPHAPTMPVTANGGTRMPAWFDIIRFGALGEDVDGLLRARAAVQALLDAEAGVPRARTVAMGFSQGAALAYVLGLTQAGAGGGRGAGEERVAGVAALSGRLMAREWVRENLAASVQTLPVFVGHGTEDAVIAHALAEDSVAYMKRELRLPAAAASGDAGVWFRTYHGLPHSVNVDEIRDVDAWLGKVLPP